MGNSSYIKKTNFVLHFQIRMMLVTLLSLTVLSVL